MNPEVGQMWRDRWTQGICVVVNSRDGLVDVLHIDDGSRAKWGPDRFSLKFEHIGVSASSEVLAQVEIIRDMFLGNTDLGEGDRKAAISAGLENLNEIQDRYGS